jgi:small subunit ribosomal protein S16
LAQLFVSKGLISVQKEKKQIKNIAMLNLRLKRCGRKGQASYRIVAMPSNTKRDGRATEELGFYNPHTNEANINVVRVKARLSQGAQPTPTVVNLLKKASISI